MREFNFVTFSNGVSVFNTTPHAITMQSPEGELVSVPNCGVLVNAKPVETPVGDTGLYVRTDFVGDEQGQAIIDELTDFWKQNIGESDNKLVIIGSIIAAQAYPGQVSGMVPVPGYERVAPSEKRMRCDRFTTFLR